MNIKLSEYMKKLIIGLLLAIIAMPGIAVEKNPIRIVCSFSDYAAIASEIAKDYAIVESISQGQSDPHFIPPKPSYAMMLNKADIWITTGMDLEQWSTTLIDRAHNRNIMDGAIGFVAVSDGVVILDKPEKADRSEGDVHLMGNPHINTSPVNWKIIARNITVGLIKVDPEHADFYERNRDAFIDRVDRALFGDELVDMFGGETLTRLLLNHTLFTFLDREYQDKKLLDLLGGWLKETLPVRGSRVIAYHKNWAYFSDIFGLEIIDFIEPKPGIPPSAKHVQYIVNLIKEQDIKVMLVASYFEKKSPQMIENRTGIKAVYLPLFVNHEMGIENNFELVDYWISQIKKSL